MKSKYISRVCLIAFALLHLERRRLPEPWGSSGV
jgi:hypothetical protein